MTFTERTPIELLAPARNLECGIAAIDHGADAVYIGAARFGARAAAGNPVRDIAELCRYAHRFGAKVYVTVNTILYDAELRDTEEMIWELHGAGADALIVQDAALLEMNLPPIALHASTQMDNRSAAKLRWLHSLGFCQAVVARELSLQEIARLHQAAPQIALEAFCHGALCVSYSGCCYASQYCFERSANRGECAQFCRLPFTLSDGQGRTLVRERHLLSLRDMNRGRFLEQMMDAGVRSFKIEGRLKDVAYVKNVTAWYRLLLEDILRRRTEFRRSSYGREDFTFRPDPDRTFSRGFTDYFLTGRQPGMSQPDSPKSRGPMVGVVREVRRDVIIVAGTASFNNGDGLCYLDGDGRLQGFRVNRAEGNHIRPARMPLLARGTKLWRSSDHEWNQLMEGRTSSRRIPVVFTIDEEPQGYRLSILRQDGASATHHFPCHHQPALTDQTQVLCDVLGRLGGTVYVLDDVAINLSQPRFIPRSLLAEWRRLLVEELDAQPILQPRAEHEANAQPIQKPRLEQELDAQSIQLPCALQAADAAEISQSFIPEHLTYAANVANRLARQFYQAQGASRIDPAMELDRQSFLREDGRLMTCRFCLKYERGWCPRQHPQSPVPPEPYYLQLSDGRRFRLSFDCRRCEMSVLAPEEE